MPNQLFHKQIAKIFNNETLANVKKLTLLETILNLQAVTNEHGLYFSESLGEKSYGRIVTLNNIDRLRVLNYFAVEETFEFDYLDKKLVTDLDGFKRGALEYVGKFEPDWEKFIDWAEKNNIFVFLVSKDDYNSYTSGYDPDYCYDL